MAAQRQLEHHGVQEAFVNVTFDHRLAYEVWLFNETLQEKSMIEVPLEVVPEQDLSTTMAAYCEKHGISQQNRRDAKAKISEMLVRDWGCDENATKVLGDSGGGQRGHIEVALTLDGQDVLVTYQPSQDLELEGARFCWEHQLRLPMCASVLRRMEDEANNAPSLHRDEPASILSIQSPVASRLYPVSERIYFELDWAESHIGKRDERICIYIDYRAEPLHCTMLPRTDPLFFSRGMLSVGYHILHFAQIAPGADGNRPTIRDFVGARIFQVVKPSIQILGAAVGRSHMFRHQVFIDVQLQATSFNVLDPAHRVCILHNGEFECFKRDRIRVDNEVMRHETVGSPYEHKVTFHAPVFSAYNGGHTLIAMLMDSGVKSFARSPPFPINMVLNPPTIALKREANYLMNLAAIVVQRPRICPFQLQKPKALAWICELWRHEWGFYSQNGEDGVLISIFHNVGVKHHTYVEFGTEDGSECNTRIFREQHNWTGLLMDGGNQDLAINLHREWVSAENIRSLLTKYSVAREVDLLSVDVDFNDYWILDAMVSAEFSPRVIVVEVNSHVPATEPRVVRYLENGSWDGFSDYFGGSVAAFNHWAIRRGYSLVYCESHGVNCFLVRNDVLGQDTSTLLSPADLQAPPNFFGQGWSYPNSTDPSHEWVWVE